jgi:flagella basal body P-ring formation protein FlgA
MYGDSFKRLQYSLLICSLLWSGWAWGYGVKVNTAIYRGVAEARVGDIISVVGHEYAQADWLNNRVDLSPFHGRWISGDELAQALHLPKQQDLRWSGLSRIYIDVARSHIDSAEVAESARGYLIAQLPGHLDVASVVLLTKQDAVVVPNGKVTYIHSMGSGCSIGPRTCIRTDILVDGVLYREVVSWFAISGSLTTPIAIKTLDAGQKAGARLFKLKRVEYAENSKHCVERGILDKEVVWLSGQIKKGDCLAQDKLGAEPMILRGQPVLLSVIDRGIALRLQGVALSDGFLNEQVKVVSDISAMPVKGVVVGRGKVHVE